MSYSDPCRGDCGANHWPDCSKECSSRQPNIPTQEYKDKWESERLRKQEGKGICDKVGHDWEYVFIVDVCKRCGESSEY